MTFVHLHGHTEFSRLDGCGKAVLHAQRAADLGQPALAITDHGNMSGVLHHMVACEGLDRDTGDRVHDPIKPIIGIEAYFREDSETHDNSNRDAFHLLLLAQNEEGWRNLLRLTSMSFRDEHFYYKPCLDWRLLERHAEGIICSTTCLSGHVPYQLLQGNAKKAEADLDRFLKIFGGRVYVEVQPHDIPEQRAVNIELANLATKKSLPLVATCDVHYPYREWSDTHDVMVMCNTGQTMATRAKADEIGEDYMKFSGDTFFIMSADEVRETFAKNQPEFPAELVDQAIANTLHIASQIEHISVDKSLKMPKASKSKADAEKIVRGWCEEGLRRIGKENDRTYTDRLEHEMTVLRDKGIFDYFIVLGHMVRDSKDAGIRVGAGRGSAAGSLVAYLIGITGLDPIGHGLIFERFLNPARAEQPDVDIDFQHNRRGEVKEMLKKRWGQDNVVDICSHMTFGVRSAIQTAARVMNVDLDETMAVTKTMDDGSGDLDLEDIRQLSNELDAYATKHPEVWKHALRLEGQVRTESKHAAGVVVTDKPVYEYMPTMRGKDESIVTQWSEQAEFPIITKYGFLKIDCLGIDALTRQAHVAQLVKERHGVEIDFEDLEQFPIVEDPDKGEEDVVQAFGQGMNLGIFQFEGRGISGLLRQIKPTSFKDLVAANALYRPGPLESGTAFSYGARKNGKEPFDLAEWGPAAKYVEETYGIMIYQEQAIQIAAELAGWGPARADEVRRAITKLSSAKMDSNLGLKELTKQQDEFVTDVKAHLGQEFEALALDVWRQIIRFTRYSFNKSHSAGYSMESYRDMWLKLRYPVEFYSALLTGETDKVPAVVREAQAMGIPIMPPDINSSQAGFAPVGDAILFGLMPVKYVGDAAIGEIMEKRPFESYEDLESRTELRKLNARAKTNLLAAGAFDCWGMRDDWTPEAKAKGELEQLGIALSANLIAQYRDVLTDRIVPAHALEEHEHGSDVTVGGEIILVKEIRTRAGKPMAFVDIEFGANSYSCTFFTEQFLAYQHFLKYGAAVLVRGYWDSERQSIKTDYACTLNALVEALNR